jgi:hypothetical protein
MNKSGALPAGIVLLFTLILPLASAQQVGVQDLDKILERGNQLLDEAKTAYESARSKSSVADFVGAGFKLEEARIKFMVLQEVGAPEKQKLATDRLRAINQLAKLIHDGKVAISGAPADAPLPKAPDPAPGKEAAPEAPPAPPKPELEVTQRAPVPEASKQKEAEKLLKEVFKDQYAKKSPADRKLLARQLLAQADKNKDDPAGLWVLYREALDAAIQTGDTRTALETIDATALFFDVDSTQLRNAALTALGKTARTPEEFAAVAAAVAELVEDQVRADQFDAADKMAALELQYSRKSGNPTLAARASSQAKDVAEAKTLYQAMKNVLATVAKNPEDPAANLEMGRYLCFVKGTWDLGLRFVVKSTDPQLQPLAEKELALPTQPSDRTALADAWSDLADKEKSALRKNRLLAHARSIYESALPDATGLLKAKIEKRLEALGASAAPPTAAPAAGSVDLLKLINPAKDSVFGDWTCDGKTLTCTKRSPNSRIQIPYLPPDEYDVTLVVERREGLEALGIGLARDATQWIIAVDGWGAGATGITAIDYRPGDSNETTHRGAVMTNGKPCTFVCTVRKDGVTMTADGKKIIDFKGNMDRLSNLGNLTMPNPKTLYVVSYDCIYVITKYVLTPVSGQGKNLR